MKTEMNIDISLDQKERVVVTTATAILEDVRDKLKDYKANGYYPFVDHIKYPKELEDIAAVMADIGRLML